MELGGRGEHLLLDALPDRDGHADELLDISLIGGVAGPAQKKDGDIAPKIWLIEAVDGSVTFITWKWRLARLGMSFLPAPGCSIAPRMSTSMMPLNSPGLSRL